jgi:hypothetical protein
MRLRASRQSVTNRQSLETLYPSLNGAAPAQHLWRRLKHALAPRLELVGVWKAYAHIDVPEPLPVNNLALFEPGAELGLSVFSAPTSDEV